MQEGHFWIILEEVYFYSFDLWRVFWELQKFMRFMEKAISEKIVADFQSFKRSSRSAKTDFIWCSKRSQQVIIQKSYFD